METRQSIESLLKDDDNSKCVDCGKQRKDMV